MIALLVACSNPAEETPPEMQELTWMLLHDFGTAAALEDAELLAAWIDEEIETPEEGYALEVPPDAYIEDLTFSANLDTQLMSGAMVLRRVRGTIDQHAAVVPEADQSFADDAYDRWDRSIENGSEADWVAGSALLTDDAIELNNFSIVIPYPMARDYRWVDLERGPSVMTRSVIYEEGWADESNGILGGFTIEMWLPEADGMIWMNATWTLVESIVDDFAEDDFYTNQIIAGSTDVMVGTEAYVNGD